MVWRYDGDWITYRENLSRYYAGRTNPALLDPAGNFSPSAHRKYISQHQGANDWASEMASDLRRWLAGRHVVDVGCGYGYWSHLLAESARSIVATDMDPVALRCAAQTVESGRVTFVQACATEIESLDVHANAVMCINVLNHFPRRVAGSVVDAINAKVGKGGRVFLAGEHYYGWRAMLYPSPDGLEDLSARLDSEAGPTEVIDNDYRVSEIVSLIGSTAVDIFVGNSIGYWTVWYEASP